MGLVTGLRVSTGGVHKAPEATDETLLLLILAEEEPVHTVVDGSSDCGVVLGVVVLGNPRRR
jgi:hypothetical protein